jgi:membrane-bound metal-dependent hydrolase YbcI (DUF457 family)
MPTPIGHSLAGITIQLASGHKLARHQLTSLLLILVVASLPDIDFLPGYWSGEPRAYHWGPTHSVFAALMVGAACGWVARLRGRRFGVTCLLVSAVYASHLLLDMMLGPDEAPSLGLQVFWPVNHDRWMMPFSLFRMAPPSIESIGPVETLFSREILPVVAREVMLLLPLAAFAGARHWLRLRKETAPKA